MFANFIITGFFVVLYQICFAQDHIDSFIISNVEIADSLRIFHNENESTLAILNRLLEHKKFHQASNVSKSLVYHKFGVVYFVQRNYKAAVDYFDATIAIREKPNFENKEDLANSFFLRGRSKLELQYHQLALEDFLYAVDIFNLISKTNESVENKRILVRYYSFVAKGYRELKDYGLATDYYQIANKIVVEAHGKTGRRTADFYSSFGRHYHLIKEKDKANKFYTMALEIYEKLGVDKFWPRILNVKLNLANQNIENEENEIAIENYKSIVKVIDNNNYDNSNLDLNLTKRICLGNIGLAYLRLGDYNQAEKSYLRALEIAKSQDALQSSLYVSLAYEGLADVAAAQSNFSESLDLYQKAINNLCLDFTSENSLALPNISNGVIVNRSTLKRILALKGKTLTNFFNQSRNPEHLTAAFQTYNSLDTLITIIRQSYQSDLSRYDLIEGTVAIYENATLAALELYELKKDEKYLHAAFDFSSKNKAIVLLEGKQKESAKYAGIPANLLEQEQALKKELYELEQTIFQESTAEVEDKQKLDSLNQYRFAQSRTYEKLIANFEKDYPEYHQLKYAASNYWDVEKLKNILPEHTALLEYFIGNDHLFIFTLSRKGLSYTRVNKPEGFEKSCQELRSFSDGTNELSLADYSGLSEKLYGLLLEEPLNQFSTEDINRLFIIPDDCLYELSFDALFYETPNTTVLNVGWGAKDLPFLINKYAISYSYSNQLLFDSQIISKKESKKLFAGFGLDYRKDDWSGTIVSGTRAVGRNWRGKIRPLPYAVEEVEKIGDLLNGDVWLNQAATKQNFEDLAGDYKILHFAMHGLVEKDFPLSSALIFDKQIDSSDYLLTAGDLYSQRLNADLVVLSACDTGSGQLQKGEGAMTLARAFKYAGCNSLIASLWSAADEPTKDIMINFYSHLKSGVPKDLAMQQAKIEYLQNDLSPNQSLPFNWSHLALIGDASAIEMAGGSSVYYWVFGLVLLLGLIFWMKR